MKEKEEPTSLDDKIMQMLTECRIVLPGTQAFLGFQLSAFLSDAFGQLSHANQLIHLAALVLVALSGILLMTPPAYHRIAEGGEMTRHFHRFASKLLLAAMIPLALGISLDFYVVLMKVTARPALSSICAALAVAIFAVCWFIVPMLRRNGSRSAAHGHELARAHTA